MLPTIANLTIILVMEGQQQAWMCLTFCTLDVLWGTVVTPWLTSNPETLGSRRRKATVRWSWMNIGAAQAESSLSNPKEGGNVRSKELGRELSKV